MPSDRRTAPPFDQLDARPCPRVRMLTAYPLLCAGSPRASPQTASYPHPLPDAPAVTGAGSLSGVSHPQRYIRRFAATAAPYPRATPAKAWLTHARASSTRPSTASAVRRVAPACASKPRVRSPTSPAPSFFVSKPLKVVANPGARTMRIPSASRTLHNSRFSLTPPSPPESQTAPAPADYARLPPQAPSHKRRPQRVRRSEVPNRIQ